MISFALASACILVALFAIPVVLLISILFLSSKPTLEDLAQARTRQKYIDYLNSVAEPFNSTNYLVEDLQRSNLGKVRVAETEFDDFDQAMQEWYQSSDYKDYLNSISNETKGEMK